MTVDYSKEFFREISLEHKNFYTSEKEIYSSRFSGTSKDTVVSLSEV